MPRSQDTNSRSVLDQIEQDARLLRSARMLPDGPLDRKTIDQVARDFVTFLAEHDISATQVSRELGKGYSPATLSKFINAGNRGGMEKIARVLNQHMELHARRQETKRPTGFVETEAARAMLVVIRTAVESNSMGLITGPAGWGKTLTLQAANAIYPGSIYFRISVSVQKHAGVVGELGRLLGINVNRSAARVYPKIIDQLRGSGRALLIDEAHKLSASGMETIRDLHDEAGVPVILSGTLDVAKLVDQREIFYGQFASRIVARVDLTDRAMGGGRRKGKKLFTVEDIRAIFEQGQLKLTTDGARFLCELACVPGLGGLRVCSKIVDIGSRIKGRQGQALDESVLKRICEQMHGDAFNQLLEERASHMRRRFAQEAAA